MNLFVEYREDNGAIFSSCGNYRYRLWRIWDKTKPIVGFVCLNPSTANSDANDPTVRRIKGFTNKWRYGGFILINLYSLISTNPKALISTMFPLGPLHRKHVQYACWRCDYIVCAWGTFPEAQKMVNTTINTLKHYGHDRLYAIKLSKDNIPMHPLYLKYTEKPIVYEKV